MRHEDSVKRIRTALDGQIPSLMEHLGVVPDPRVARPQRHELLDILAIALPLFALIAHAKPLRHQRWECLICSYQSSSVVGTVFEPTKLPLSVWFLAMYLLTQSKNSVCTLSDWLRKRRWFFRGLMAFLRGDTWAYAFEMPIRLSSSGEAVPWTLSKGEQRWEGTPQGRFSANSPAMLVRLACAGSGIVAVPDLFAMEHVLSGELQRVLPDWHLPSPIAWAVFPERRLMPTKTRAFIDLLQQALSDPSTSPVAPTLGGERR